MLRSALAAPLLSVLLLTAAGCLSSPSSQGGSDGPDASLGNEPFVNPIIIEHDHTDFSAHVLSNNVELIGHSTLAPAGENVPGGLGEIDVVNNYAYVAVFNHGFAIVDLSNPAEPILVSLTDTPTPPGNPLGKYTADLKVDRTGDWVFLAMELSEYPGVLIYDARDKAAPKLAGFWPEPGLLLGCHMVEYAVINEQEYLFCAPLDNAIYVGLLLPEAGGVREVVQVARFVPTTEKFVNQQVARFQEDQVGWAADQVSGHQDMTYQLDPITLAPTLFVSFWNLGMRIVDVSNPALPLEIGSWAGEDSDLFHGALHTTVAFLSDEGKRIIATIPEGANPPALFVLDATDLDNPKTLSAWTALPDFKGEHGTFSLHNFQILDGTVYIAMGHGGLMALDISTPELQASPNPVASYLPHEPRPDGEPYQGYYWDSVLWNGYWLTADGSGGFYVLHKLGDPAGDVQFTSFA
ncbi:MAG: hypothetical protein AABX89_05380 [Candidatus Thermoplasmatota archaeon]